MAINFATNVVMSFEAVWLSFMKLRQCVIPIVCAVHCQMDSEENSLASAVGVDSHSSAETLILPCCLTWSVDEVGDWIESIGYPLYRVRFDLIHWLRAQSQMDSCKNCYHQTTIHQCRQKSNEKSINQPINQNPWCPAIVGVARQMSPLWWRPTTPVLCNAEQ